MCILCEPKTLELLTSPLARFAPGQLAEAIRVAREAAGAGVLDYAETVLRGAAAAEVDSELYAEIVVGRARDAGLLDRSETNGWGVRLRTATAAPDPRVQAFLSSCAEIIDEYRILLAESRQVLARFLETPPDALGFTGIGQDGELWFEHRGESYTVLSEAEAMEIVERELREQLQSLSAEVLLGYSKLPDAGREVIAEVQARPAEVANEILAGMIDLSALADDRVRLEGYGPFFRNEAGGSVEDLRFGEWIVIRLSQESD